MDWFATLSLALGSAWTSGINLYATVTILGLLEKFGFAKLPGGLDVLNNWWIIGIAGVLFLVEFFADKIPYLDSVWDVVHTFIRIPAGAIVAYSATTQMDPAVTVIATLLGGGLALSSHGTKAAARATAELRRLLDSQLSLRSRIGHVALLLASAAMTVVVASLSITEPALPARTAAAFAAMTMISLAWVAFSGWVLTRRRPLFGRDRVVAGRMAVIFTSTFMAVALAIAYSSGGRAPVAAAVMGLLLVAAAVTLLVHARRNVLRLTSRREALEHELAPLVH